MDILLPYSTDPFNHNNIIIVSSTLVALGSL